MLSYDQLMQVLTDSNINSEDFTIENIKRIYGHSLNHKKAMELIENLVLAAVDFDFPLYDVLAYANELEEHLEISEDNSAICDILDIVVDNLQVCEENAERLFDLAEEVDILNVYNTLMLDYQQYLNAKQIDEITEKAKNAFDANAILW